MKYKKTWLALFLLFTIAIAYGGNKNKYPFSDVPQALLKNSSAVLRNKTVVFERNDLNSSKQKMSYAITILNKGGERFSYFVQPYFKFARVSNVSAVVYDKNGKKVKKIAKDDILDIAIESATSLYSDQRAVIISPDYDDYPFTVEYSWTISYSGSLNIPRWNIYHNYNISIQQEDFTMITPIAHGDHNGLSVRYYVSDSTLKLKRRIEDGKNIYSLHVENLPALNSERYTYSIDRCTPTVYFAPVSFAIGKYKGSFDSWKTFGEFQDRLLAERDNLSEESQKRIKELVAGETDQKTIVEILYKYMQNKVRYVSEQKGIGGWQPIRAQKVDELSYGDCKGLTNYMKSLLKVAGITAHFTLVHAGSNSSPIISDFPSNQFNHAILCVPFKDDTVWLECTSQHVPCGYLGSFTDDREALVIDEQNGAALVRTPAYNEKINNRYRSVDAILTSRGDCDIDIKTKNSGFFYDDELRLYLDTRDHQKQKLLKRMHFSTVTLSRYSFKEDMSNIPVINSDIELAVTGYATRSGNRLLLTPNLFFKKNDTHFRKEKRHAPIVIRRSYSTTDTIVFHLPKGYVASDNIAEKSVVSKYGTYRSYIQKQADRLVYIREFNINRGTFPPSEWEQFTAFHEKVAKLDKAKIVLMKEQ